MNELAQTLEQPIESPRIRFASEVDIPDLIRLGMEWAKDMEYEISEEVATAELSNMLKTGVIFLLTFGNQIVGFMGAYINTHAWSGKKQGHERYLFVSKEHRSHASNLLILTFEKWARFRGCSSVMLYPSNYGSNRADVFKRLLEGTGYKLFGYHMLKEL